MTPQTHLSVALSAHNEGELLSRTIASVLENHRGLTLEILVTDDGSTDRSIELARKVYPDLRVLRQRIRVGPSSSKGWAARESCSVVLVFMDAHCKPQAKTFNQMLRAIDETSGEAIVTPRLAALDVRTWQNKHHKIAHGSNIDLQQLSTQWLTLHEMRRRGRFYESPTLVGSCFAITRHLYFRLGGFDPDMRLWGHEDLDLGLKAWTMGYAVLHDPEPLVGHRFQTDFSYPVPSWAPLMNQLRIAAKHFAPSVWQEWRRLARERTPHDVWEDAWNAFVERRGSLETQRLNLWQQRKYDEFWFADRFSLAWPKRH